MNALNSTSYCFCIHFSLAAIEHEFFIIKDSLTLSACSLNICRNVFFDPLHPQQVHCWGRNNMECWMRSNLDQIKPIKQSCFKRGFKRVKRGTNKRDMSLRREVLQDRNLLYFSRPRRKITIVRETWRYHCETGSLMAVNMILQPKTACDKFLTVSSHSGGCCDQLTNWWHW